jgi:iron complex transport system ATP-binding protein
MSGKAILIRARGISAGYGGKDAIADVSFELREGERLAVIGPNGSGKTTLLRVLAGTVPYRGSLAVSAHGPEGKTETERSRLVGKASAREFAFLAQISEVYFPFTVEETVMLGRYARQKRTLAASPSEADRKAVERALDTCGLGELRSEPLSRLSGGQLQRAFLARAFAQDPAILLLDEPSNHLDLRYQLSVLDSARDWAAIQGEDGRPRAAVGVLHDLSLALRFADTVILLDGGRITDAGSPGKVLSGEACNRAYGMNVAKTMRDLLETW